MPFKLARPEPAFDPAGGLALCEHFQMAYATNDIDRAGDIFRKKLGIREFRRLEGPMPAGGYIRADLAWVGTLMYELVQADGEGGRIFTDRLPGGDGFKVRHHHLGFLIHDQQQWDGIAAGAAKAGWPIPHRNSNPLLQSCFVDAPELGHYLEYLFANEAGLDFFASVPRS